MVTHLHQSELAKRWALEPRTLEQWRWQGVGPKFLKLRGRVVYRMVDIEEYEEAHLRSSTSDDRSSDIGMEHWLFGDGGVPECRG